MKSDIWDFHNIKTINNLVISHIFAHLNLLFIRLSVEWSVRDDSDYDVEDDNTAKWGDSLSGLAWSHCVTFWLVLVFALSLPPGSISFPFSFQIFSIVHVFSHERRSAVFYHLSNAGCAHTHTETQRKMMRISNAVGKIEILHMINGRNGKNIKNSYEINENEMIKQFVTLVLAHSVAFETHQRPQRQTKTKNPDCKNMHISCDANVCNNCCQFFLWAGKANETI